MSLNRSNKFVDSAEKEPPENVADSMTGRRVGIYELKKELGRGGMGAVYLAERIDGEFHQRVAVKLVKRGMDTDFVLNRFRHERQILASLEHPFIARLLDGGTTDDGLPYFVMDFIEGVALIEFCEKNDLKLRERLELFLRVCEAVNFAHRKKIVHRDLKPSNILVTDQGTPKLLDFGIAKLLNPEEANETLMPTATQMRLMTAEYAAPEQIRGEEITPATDVYSLGVLLFELATGERPYKFPSRAPHDIARVICEEEAQNPSKASSAQKNEINDDLSNIILKSLSKKPADRYASVKEFSADIERFLKGKAVSAKPRGFPVKAVQKPFFEKSPTGSRSIAVLPLKFLSSASEVETDDRFLSLGLTDALIAKLSSVRRFALRPTSSVLRYGETNTDSFAAGKELGVEFVVDGHIQKAGEQIRVSIQLLNVVEQTIVWAERFNEKSADVLELEDSISKRVAESLIPHLTSDERKHLARRETENAAAYEAYLRGRFYWNQFTPESLPKAFDSFQTAARLDPNYALAYVGLSDFYIWANIYGIIPSAEATPLAEDAAHRAIELNPKQGEAYATLGLINQNRMNWAESENLYEKALELKPNYVHAYEWRAAYLVGSGNIAEGVEEIKRAERVDPLSLRTKTLTAWTFYQARLFDEAILRGNQILELDKNYPQGHAQIGISLLAKGLLEEAVAHLQKFDAMIPQSALAKYQLCHALVAADRKKEARAILEEIKTQAREGYVKPYFLGVAYAAFDMREEAFACFEQSFAENDPWLLWFATEPMLDCLREDKRYLDLIRRLKNPILERKINKPKSPDTEGEKSIAVLPLKIIAVGGNTGSGDDEYLSVGLADALITRLSNVRRFVVRPTSSVLQFAGENTDSFGAGRRLGVDYVVEGNIRRIGERIRVTIQLLSVNENSSRWAEKFDEHFTDVLELEDSISERVAKSLLPHLTGEEEKQLLKRGTNNPDAYEAFLRGRFNWNLHSEEGFSRAIGFYRRAIELDSGYALAYAAIAEYYIFLGIHCVIPFAEGSKAAKEAAETAIRIDPTLAEGYASLGFVEISYNFDWKAAEKHMLDAISMNPNSVAAHSWYNTVLLHSGRFAESMREIDRVLELDPDSLLGLHFRAWALYHSRRFEESIAVHQRMLRNEPNHAWGLQTYSWALRRVGKFHEAVTQAARAVELTGENPFYLMALAAANAEAGNLREAKKFLTQLDKISKTRFVSEYMLSLVYCAMGNKERAFENLEKSLSSRDGWIVWIGVEPQFDLLRDDARFDDLLRRLNHPLARSF